jgi:hypothetical protein
LIVAVLLIDAAIAMLFWKPTVWVQAQRDNNCPGSPLAASRRD